VLLTLDLFNEKCHICKMRRRGVSKQVVIIVGVLNILLIIGCKKVETTKTYTVSDSVSQSTIAFDEVTVNNELDQFVDDAIMVLSNHNATIAGAIFDSISPNVYEIDYFNKEPDGVKARSGSDSIHLNGIPWGAAGSTATLSFKDINSTGSYEIAFYSIIPPLTDSASLTFLGNITITNVYGGLLQSVTSSSDSLVAHIRASNVSFTFNDQASSIQFYSLNVNEIRSFTTANSAMYATTRGDTNVGGYSNIGTWGTNRFGNNYYSNTAGSIVQNISNLALLSYNPISGTKVIEGISEPIQSIYGVNNQGAVTSGTPYGFSISWTDNSVQATDILPYYY